MSPPTSSQTGLWGVAAVVLCVATLGLALLAGTAQPVEAQGWWPWSGGGDSPPPAQRAPPVPREPVYRGGPGQPPPPPGPGQGVNPPPPGPGPGTFAQPGAGAQSNKAPICVQLEQRLVMERQRGNASRDTLPKLEAELRQVDRSHQSGQAQLEKGDCYDYFLFSKSLRRTPKCVDLATQVDASKRRLAELDTQRQQILGSRERSYEDDIVRDLARNSCGAIYSQEAARRGNSGPFSSLWQDEDTGPSRGSDFGALPFATYRTVCVRLCDGYFFPVSFSTLTNHFERDMDVCQTQCAAPAELFYHQNPGGTMEQAVSARTNSPYISLKTAFRYRKEYVQGCSCKQTDYTPSPADRGDRRAEPVAPASGRQVQR